MRHSLWEHETDFDRVAQLVQLLTVLPGNNLVQDAMDDEGRTLHLCNSQVILETFLHKTGQKPTDLISRRPLDASIGGH